jgi:hypothetical protein
MIAVQSAIERRLHENDSNARARHRIGRLSAIIEWGLLRPNRSSTRRVYASALPARARRSIYSAEAWNTTHQHGQSLTENQTNRECEFVSSDEKFLLTQHASMEKRGCTALDESGATYERH